MKQQEAITPERAVLMVIGMALFWQILRFRNVTEMLPYGSPGLLCFVTSLGVAVACTAFFPKTFERMSISPWTIGTCAVTAAGALALQWAAKLLGWWDASSLAACALGVLAGASEALLLVGWYTFLAKLGSRDDRPLMALLFGSAILGLLVAAFLFSLSPFSGLFPVLVPPLAALCLHASLPSGNRRQDGGCGIRRGSGRDGRQNDNASCPVSAPITTPARAEAAPENSPKAGPGLDVPERLRQRLLNFGAPPSGMLLMLLAMLGLLGNLVLAFNAGGSSAREGWALWLRYLLSFALIGSALISLHRCENERKTSFAIGLILAFTLVAGMALAGFANLAAQNVGIAVVTSCKTCIEVLVLFLLVRDTFDCRVAYGNLAVLFAGPVVVAFAVGQWAIPAALGESWPLAAGHRADLFTALAVLSLTVLAILLAVAVVRSFDAERVPDWTESTKPLTVQPEALNRSATQQVEDSLADKPPASGPQAVITQVNGAQADAAQPAEPRAATPDDLGLPAETVERIALIYGLTLRETQIFVYAFRGYSLQHIADIDVVSLNTVKSHWKNLYRKLDVHTRQELISLAEAHMRESSDNQGQRG